MYPATVVEHARKYVTRGPVHHEPGEALLAGTWKIACWIEVQKPHRTSAP